MHDAILNFERGGWAGGRSCVPRHRRRPPGRRLWAKLLPPMTNPAWWGRN